MSTGTINFSTLTKALGLIVPDDGSKDVFVHITVLPQGYNPVEGQRVSYTIQETAKGLNAVNVLCLDDAA
ncbi:MAG: cold shock domain-containing protein [Candidatus Absconditabacterales bacterium]|nr:cold shock domain-containing protein [Candidatus Absconditabacterales bacterium]